MKRFDKYNQQKLRPRFSRERTRVNSRKDPGQFTKGPGSIHERTPVNSRHISGVIRKYLLTKLKLGSYGIFTRNPNSMRERKQASTTSGFPATS